MAAYCRRPRGLSPLTRGKLNLLWSQVIMPRPIPADAGETFRRHDEEEEARAYPR